jgi:hypothetical protein
MNPFGILTSYFEICFNNTLLPVPRSSRLALPFRCSGWNVCFSCVSQFVPNILWNFALLTYPSSSFCLYSLDIFLSTLFSNQYERTGETIHLNGLNFFFCSKVYNVKTLDSMNGRTDSHSSVFLGMEISVLYLTYIWSLSQLWRMC